MVVFLVCYFQKALIYPLQLKLITSVNRKVCCSTIKSLYSNEGRHGGEATLEAVRLIADIVKAHNCQLHPDSIEV